MLLRPALLSLYIITSCACSARHTPPTTSPEPVREELGERVEILPYLDGVWLHTTWRTYQGALIPSHGVIIERPDMLVLVDSAWGDAFTLDLLEQIEQRFGKSPDVLLITHAHDDRASGLDHIASRGTQIWASTHTAERLSPERRAHITHLVDDPERAQSLATSDVMFYWPGPGHTFDNVIVWEPRNQLVFGGCLVRPGQSMTLGNTADAHPDVWGQSTRNVYAAFPKVSHVVPSHGVPAGPELLAHTIALTDRR